MQNVAFTHDKSDKILAKKIFGNFTSPTPLSSESVGRYNKGCLNGGVELPTNGKTWQHINSKRGRNWGHPTLIDFTRNFQLKLPVRMEGPLYLRFRQPKRRSNTLRTCRSSNWIGSRYKI